jgi:ERCC4-type nuclease
MEIIADTRERKVLDLLAARVAEGNLFRKSTLALSTRVQQIEQGDYVINYLGSPVAIIERKTMKDYSSSIKDGRSDNKEKMKLFAQNAGPHCRVYYIVEGPANPAYDHQFAGIAWKNIQASIDRLSIVDNIHVIRTTGKLQTADRLCFLAESLGNCIVEGLIAPIAVEGGYAKVAKDSTIAKTDHAKALKMWNAIRGVGRVSAVNFCSEFSLSEIYFMNVAERPRALRAVDWKVVLSAAHGFTAKSIPGIQDAMILSEQELAKVEVNGRKIGKAKAATLKRLLTFKAGNTTNDPLADSTEPTSSSSTEPTSSSSTEPTSSSSTEPTSSSSTEPTSS